jgi:broad specificity phosphatase PhoE
MTRLIFVRHAATDGFASRLAGRDADVHLSAEGKIQGQRLAHALMRQRIGKIYSSPQPRARETAQFMAELFGDSVRIAAQLDEIDYGDWTGRTFEELRAVAQWREFNSVCSCTRIPNGELMIEVQARVLALMERLCQRHPAMTVALVSHGDVIRARWRIAWACRWIFCFASMSARRRSVSLPWSSPGRGFFASTTRNN